MAFAVSLHVISVKCQKTISEQMVFIHHNLLCAFSITDASVGGREKWEINCVEEK